MRVISCIIPAAGRGRRLGSKQDKVFALLDNEPILFHALRNLQKAREIQAIILVVSKRSLNYTESKFFRNLKFTKIKKIVPGGRTRADSVWNGLKEISANTEFVLIHDGARPFIDLDSLKKLIKAGKRYGAAVLGIPVNATVKKVKNFRTLETVERKFLWEIQTPQIFEKNLLINSYLKARRERFKPTDDAQIVERYGYKVRVVRGSPLNIKITRQEDLVLAKAISRIKKND